MNKKLLTPALLLFACGTFVQPVQAQKDPCAINQRKLTKAQSVVDRLNIRKDKLLATRDKQEGKWERGKEKKRTKTLNARIKQYNRYSPDCFDSATPPTVTTTPDHTEDASSRCTGARNREANLFAKQTRNEESEFPAAKFEKKVERMDSKIDKAQAKVDSYQEFLDNNCSG
jgi:peptidoglycan hydrolase CwlO-like protein